MPPSHVRSLPASTSSRDAITQALLRAAVTCLGTQGSSGSSVRDLLRESGISSQTFYTRFSSKADCFATLGRILAEQAGAQLAMLVGDAPEPGERLRRAVAGIPRVAAAHPVPARVLLLESFVVGGEALAIRFAAIDAAAECIGGDAEVVRAVLGATLRIALERTLPDAPSHAPDLSLDLATWADVYAGLDRAALLSMEHTPSRRRGRAPGTLVPPGPDGTRRLRPGPKREPRAFVEQYQRDRILDGVAAVVARDGFDGLTTRALSTTSEIDSKALYRHFASLDEAFTATLLVGGRSALDAALPALQAPADWRAGVSAGLRTLLEFLSEEPVFAQIALIGALSFGVAGAALQREALDTCAAMLAGAYQRGGIKVASIVPRAVAAGMFELCADRLHHGAAEELLALEPLLSVLALAPAVGLDEAIAFVTDRRVGEQQTG
jgi:AcrR family transcriptional regulator